MFGLGGGGQGGWERRVEAFVKIKKKIFFFYFFLGGSRVGGGGGGGASGGGASGGGFRVDVNEEEKFL